MKCLVYKQSSAFIMLHIEQNKCFKIQCCLEAICQSVDQISMKILGDII